MLSETMWITLAFIAFIALSYRPLKLILLSNLDNKIKKIEDELNVTITAKIEAQNMLEDLRKEYQEAKADSQKLRDKAKEESELIFEEVKKSLLGITEKGNNLINGYKDHQERMLIANFKHDVITTVLTLIENEITSKLSPEEQSKLLEDSKRMLKTLWN